MDRANLFVLLADSNGVLTTYAACHSLFRSLPPPAQTNTEGPVVSYKQIWAPWRLDYILGIDASAPIDETGELLPEGDPECFLCHCAVSGDDDRRQRIVRLGERTVTLLNRYPYNNGHLLVAPREHLARLDQLDDALQLALSREVTRSVGLLEAVLRPEGFNVGLNLGRPAGAGLPGHLHWHIVPRWSGDTNFMAIVSDARVIPQSLDALWEALRAEQERKATG